jgi:hypothetical protein
MARNISSAFVGPAAINCKNALHVDGVPFVIVGHHAGLLGTERSMSLNRTPARPEQLSVRRLARLIYILNS